MNNEEFYKYGNPTCYKMGNNKGWRCELPYTDENGTRKRKTFSGGTKKEVLGRKDKFLVAEKERRKQAVLKKRNVTIPDLLRESAETAFDLGTIKASSYDRKLNTIKIIEARSLAAIPIVEIKKEDIIAFLKDVRTAGYSDSVLKKIFGAVSSAFELARDKDLLTENLMKSAKITRPKSTKETKKIAAFSINDQQKFEKALNSPRFQKEHVKYADMFRIEMSTGMRFGEIAALTTQDVDFKNKKIFVTKTVSRDSKGRPCVNSTKTKAGNRVVPFGKHIEQVLKNAVDGYRYNEYGFLFYDFRNDHPVYAQMANSFFHRICEKTGIQTSGGQHLLRHTFATRAIEAGVTPVVLQRWLGHTDIRVTLNTYTDVFANMHSDNIEKLEKYAEEVIFPQI